MKYTAQQLNKMFYPIGGNPMTFKFPEGGKFQIEGWSMLDKLAVTVNRVHVAGAG